MEKLYILGCGSALPASGRNPTAQVLEHAGKYFLIDCGEGTQTRLRERKLSFDKITHIFISHMHGDHYLGLPGLLSTMQLLGRKKELHLFGPSDLFDLLDFQFKVSKTVIGYPFHKHVVNSEAELFCTDKIKVRSIRLNHRITCFGYVFEEVDKPRRIDGIAVKRHNVPHYLMGGLRKGDDFITESGVMVKNSELTRRPKPAYTYAFCSDNRISPILTQQLKGVDVLYHEATFLHKDLEKAVKTFHSTVKEVVDLAKVLPFKKVIFGHFSARYKDTDEIENECILLGDRALIANDRLVLDFSKL